MDGKLRTRRIAFGTFGGNSNWRGPVWFPVNYLIIESLQKFDYYYGEDFKIEFPTGSENMLSLWEVSQELEKRLTDIFLKDEDGNRAVFGNNKLFQKDENWRDYILFYEYFHGDHGCGLGASHQTGWTGLIGKLLQQLGEYSQEESGKHIETVQIEGTDGQIEAVKFSLEFRISNFQKYESYSHNCPAQCRRTGAARRLVDKGTAKRRISESFVGGNRPAGRGKYAVVR